jgi:hypothetical protein
MAFFVVRLYFSPSCEFFFVEILEHQYIRNILSKSENVKILYHHKNINILRYHKNDYVYMLAWCPPEVFRFQILY